MGVGAAMISTRPFRAFVSYSHADRTFAARLQRRLEAYRLPRRLADQVEPLPGQPPGRIGPVFRDRADLSAATDLSAAVRDGIAASSALVVVASPDAAASPWVAREIDLFRALHPDAPVLVALARGEPSQALPEALRTDPEPLCADFRKDGDGRRLAFLKIVAGLSGLPLDALVQRDSQRQMRRVMAVTLGAGVLVVIMALLLIAAVQARQEAERQRAEAERQRAGAEGLVEYMLTDLRERLKGVLRLDVMSGVNERALAYYSAQGDLDRLPDDSLERRARVLHLMGADNESAGNLDKALNEYREAHRTTAAILAKKPRDPDRIFAHAQSEFYLGSIARRRSERATASAHWRAYLSQAQALARAEPAGARGVVEQAYAWGNLCDLDLQDRYDLESAVAACARSVRLARLAVARSPAERPLKEMLANRLGAMGSALFAARRFDEAFRARDAEAELMETLLGLDPRNVNYQMRRSWPDLARAHILIESGRPRRAAALLQACMARFPDVFRGDTQVSDMMVTRLRAHLLLASARRRLGLGHADQLALADDAQGQLAAVSDAYAKRGAAIRASIWPQTSGE